MVQFYKTSHGKIHVANNPYRMLCGQKLKIAAEPMGDKVDHDTANFLPRLSVCRRSCERAMKIVKPKPYIEIDESYDV